MPEASILITARDKYSSQIKAMSNVTKSFSKDTDGLESKLRKLDKMQDQLTDSVAQSKKRIKELQRQFEETGDAADKLRLDTERTNFHTMQRELDLTRRAARETEREIRKLSDTSKGVGGSSGGSGGGMKSTLAAFGINQIGQQVSQLAEQAVSTFGTSSFGAETGAVLSSLAGGTLSGASAGFMVGGPVGALVGGLIGLVGGAASGAMQVYSNRDDAFKAYVQEQVEGAYEQRGSDIQAGSAIAAGRETNLVSFTTLFGDKGVAEGYLADLVDMANTTPFLYDDLVAMSKTLATYKYGADSILPVLTKIGDAGAALGMTTADMSMVATALGRMKSSDKATLEYLNILNDRGIGAVNMLAEAKGMSVGETYTAISKGQIKGGEAVEIILAALEESYGGSMKTQSETFSGKSSTLEGLKQELQNAYGEGYNAERKKGIQTEIDWLSGTSGDAQAEANRAVGAWQASLENAKERYIRSAIDAAMSSAEYQFAKDEGDAATMGRLIAQARIKGNSDYLANEGKDQELADQLALAEAIRTSPETQAAYMQAGYAMGQQFSKGMMAGTSEFTPVINAGVGAGYATFDANGYVVDPSSGLPLIDDNGDAVRVDVSGRPDANAGVPFGFAVGLGRVPYDNFPAVLHEGERVLTAREAREMDAGGGGGVTVTVSGNTFNVRQESDVDAIAQAIAREIEIRRMGGAF